MQNVLTRLLKIIQSPENLEDAREAAASAGTRLLRINPNLIAPFISQGGDHFIAKEIQSESPGMKSAALNVLNLFLLQHQITQNAHLWLEQHECLVPSLMKMLSSHNQVGFVKVGQWASYTTTISFVSKHSKLGMHCAKALKLHFA